MFERSKKDFLIDLLVDIGAGILIGLGLEFAAKTILPVAGVSGLALIFYTLYKVPMGLMIIVINIPIMLITFRTLGKQFFLNSLHSTIITSLIIDLIDYISNMSPKIDAIFDVDLLLAALASAVLSGLGYAFIYMRDSSTGGIDFLIMAIKQKHPHFSVGRISFVLDGLVVTLGALIISRSMDAWLYGLINAYVLAVVIDKIMYGTNEGKVTLIVTDMAQEICQMINSNYDRGSTILKGTGAYTNQEHEVIMCCCSTKQMYGIRRMVKKIDSKAFFVIMESSDVVGEGFKEE